MGDLRRGAQSKPASERDAALEATGVAGTETAQQAAAIAAADPPPSPPDDAALAHTLDGPADINGNLSDGAAGLSSAASAISVNGKVRAAHRVGRYLILRQIGAGGMGVVFAAYDEELDRKVAVKLLRQAGDARSDLRTRILREAQAMARLSHPNVVQIYEVGEVASVAGQVFIAMEFIEGTTLSDWQRARSWEEVLPVYLQAGQGLGAAHESGLIHRDFKPDNVLVGKDGRPRVADFGLARTKNSEPVAAAAAQAPAVLADPGSEMRSGSLLVTPLTQAGAILGTPAYMSPEQYRSEPTDSRCDQFSFCAALYEALYKTLPFAGHTLSELRQNVLAGKVRPPPPKTTVPPRVYAALRRGLQTDPAQRFASMGEMLNALSFDPQRDPAAAPKSRRRLLRVMVILMLVVLGALFPAARHGAVTTLQVLSATGVFLLGCSLVAFFQRQVLLHNTFHRSLMIYLAVFTAQQLCIHGLALLTGLTPRQTLPMEMVGMAGISVLIVHFMFQRGWFVPVLLLGSALWAALRPQDGGFVTSVSYPFCMLCIAHLWESAARVGEPKDETGLLLRRM